MIGQVLVAGAIALGMLTAPGGNSYYVSPNGLDSNAGTEATPWKTVQKAADSAGPGDTVLIMEGTYPESVLVQRSGEEGRPITFRNYADQKPVIDGQAQPNGRGVFSILGQQHIVVSGLRIINGWGRGQSGIHCQDSGHLLITKCYTFNTGSSGIKLIHCTDSVVDGNEIEWGCQNGAEENITVKIDSDRIQISNNHIHNSRDEGIDCKEGARNVRVFGNLIHDVERQGLYADAWNRETYNIEFSGNIIHDCGFGMAACSETGGLLHDISYVNNIVYNCEGPGMVVASWGRRGAHPIQGVRFINNTIYKTGTRWGGGLRLENPEAKDLVIRNNIYAGCGDEPLQVFVTPASWTFDHNLWEVKAEGQGEDAVIGDPKFVDAKSGNLHLQKGSAAVDAGSAEGAPALDIDGQKRPSGKAVDLGADELSTEEPVKAPTGPTVKPPVPARAGEG
jgi:hypothetical protein